MKVVINYSVEVDDNFRRAINMQYGRSGLANREEVKRWFVSHGHSMDNDLMDSLPEGLFFDVDAAAKYVNITVREFQKRVILGLIGGPEPGDDLYWTVETLDKYLKKVSEDNG